MPEIVLTSRISFTDCKGQRGAAFMQTPGHRIKKKKIALQKPPVVQYEESNRLAAMTFPLEFQYRRQ